MGKWTLCKLRTEQSEIAWERIIEQNQMDDVEVCFARRNAF